MPKRPRALETSDEEEIESSSTVLDKLLESAKAETNSGLRGKSKTKQRRNSPPKSSTKKPTAARNTVQKVGQITVVSCGLVRITEQSKKRRKAVDLADTHQLAEDDFPSFLDIRRLKVRSQAVINKQDGIEFNTNWTHLQVDQWIRQQLPSFSNHLDQLPARRNPSFTPDTSPPYEEFLPKYFLCTKERMRAVLVPGATFFTGSDISDAVEDLQKRNFKFKVLLLCTLDEFELMGATAFDDESGDEEYVRPSKHIDDSPEPEPGPSQPRTRHAASSSRRVLARTTSLDLEIEKEFMASTAFLTHAT